MDEQVKPCNVPCPKCGSGEVHRVFHARGSKVPNSDYHVPKHPGFTPTLDGWSSYAAKELILNSCKCCHYEWTAKPLRKSPKRAYYETHDAPHCPTCDCGTNKKSDGAINVMAAHPMPSPEPVTGLPISATGNSP